MDAVLRDRAILAEWEERAARITDRAGRLLLERFVQPVTLEFKDEKRTDPITAVDREVEVLVREALRVSFPSHGILGEEGTSDQIDSELLWTLDPLDGTANFAGALPLFGVSLALLRNGVPIVGCLFVPHGPKSGPAVLRGSFGNGARVDGSPLRVSRDPFEPNRPVAVPPGLAAMFRLRNGLAGRPGEVRNLGSICHELAMVAGGGFRYAVFAGPRLWDVAGGIVLIREAGGVALVWNRDEWREFDRFRPPPPRGGKPTSLRDWAQPILVGTPSALRYVAPRLRPRRPPPLAVRWFLARRRARWWRIGRAESKRLAPAEAKPPGT
jgi:myo-inositol-1(or 4)-monophosphatase